MNADDFHDLMENLALTGFPTHDVSFNEIADMMVEAGIDVSDLSPEQIEDLMGLTHDQQAVLGETPDVATNHHGDELRFGSGACGWCGGQGYIYHPSGDERCWHCNGSGVAH